MALKYKLDPVEQRVLGCLIEKEVTTPDQYPLSLNSLTNACNQKSNRDPVMSLAEADVQDTLTRLKDKRLIASETGFGSRVMKYRHRFCNTEFGDFRLTDQELGILCVMFVRGPQTPGELRTRTNRLCEFSDVSQVEKVLQDLQSHDDGPLVVRLEREPGKREARYAHTLGTEAIPKAAAESGAQATAVAAPSDDTEYLLSLEERIEALEQKVSELEARLSGDT